jgi:hypothetical protein
MLFAPAGTPQPVIEKLHREIVRPWPVLRPGSG